jgi:hypothetical protein
MRNLDRKKHADSYPNLTFPDMFILEGGYKAFFEAHKVRLYLRNLRWSNTLWLGLSLFDVNTVYGAVMPSFLLSFSITSSQVCRWLYFVNIPYSRHVHL